MYTHADILKRAYLCQVSDTGSPEPLVFITHSQIYNFLIVWLRLLILGIYIHQLIWIHWSWLLLYLWSWPLTPRSNYRLIWKYRVLLIPFLSLGLDFKFILYRYMYIMYNAINRICLLDLEHYYFPFKTNHNCLLETLETYYLLFASCRTNYFF